MLDQMVERDLASRTPGLKRLQEQVQLLKTFAERQEEIDSARQTLEAHRGEFEKFMKDQGAYLERARIVFSDERFSTAWFKQEEVALALKHVGYSPSASDDQSVRESLRAAILHLADMDTRMFFSMLLLNCLPGYVAAGQIIEGWIVDHCAYQLVDHPDDSNVFLFEMFCRGYDALQAEKRARDNKFLQEFGMDMERLKAMSMDEIDTWVEQQTAPEARAKIEAVFNANPGAESIGVANIENMERDSVTLLDREDARPLMLSMEEMSPWLLRFQECFRGALQQLPGGAPAVPDAQSAKALIVAVAPVIRDMATGIFSPERIAQLAAQLKVYRNERFEAGDKRVAGLAQSAIMLINTEREPAEIYFLICLCFHSIRCASAE